MIDDSQDDGEVPQHNSPHIELPLEDEDGNVIGEQFDIMPDRLMGDVARIERNLAPVDQQPFVERGSFIVSVLRHSGSRREVENPRLQRAIESWGSRNQVEVQTFHLDFGSLAYTSVYRFLGTLLRARSAFDRSQSSSMKYLLIPSAAGFTRYIDDWVLLANALSHYGYQLLTISANGSYFVPIQNISMQNLQATVENCMEYRNDLFRLFESLGDTNPPPHAEPTRRREIAAPFYNTSLLRRVFNPNWVSMTSLYAHQVSLIGYSKWSNKRYAAQFIFRHQQVVRTMKVGRETLVHLPSLRSVL
jgi:hypothetical protein